MAKEIGHIRVYRFRSKIQKVFQGPRGGKYVIVDKRRRYLRGKDKQRV